LTATAPTDPEGAAGAPASAEPTTTPSAPPEADFLQRARENPQWAEEQIKQFQSRADRAEAENKKLVEQIGPVKDIIDQYQAPTVKAVVDNYIALRNNPEVGEMIQEFERTGQLPARKGSDPNADDDEYKTPEEREFEALRAEIAALKQDTNANTLASGQEMLTKHMESVFREYNFAPEDVEQMRKTMITQIETWQSQGDAGINALKSLGSRNGYKTVKGIMLADVPPEAFQRAVANSALRKQQELSGLATDGPSGNLSTGREPPPEFASALEAARWARANPEGHDSM